MNDFFYRFYEFLNQHGNNTPDYPTIITALLIILAVGLLTEYVCRRLLIPAISKIVRRTDTIWDDYLLNPEVLKGMSHLISPLLLYISFPWIEREASLGGAAPFFILLVGRLITVCLVILILRLLFLIVAHAESLSMRHERLQKHYIAGVFQFVKLLVFLIGSICIIAILIDRSPLNFIAGLGAAATVLMFVFKDVILGLVAGIQLTTNKMLKPGDWITLPQKDIEGTVEEVSLISVKVRGFDNTIYTIPPYTLVSDIFQNWQAMADRGGRRVKRSIFIDINTVSFCDEERITALKAKGLFTEGGSIDTVSPINLTLYRRYIESFLLKDERVNKEFFTLVRHVQGNAEGVPLEFYFFFFETSFVAYERLAADYMDYFIAILPQFGLSAYQRPAGTDLRIRKDLAV